MDIDFNCAMVNTYSTVYDIYGYLFSMSNVLDFKCILFGFSIAWKYVTSDCDEIFEFNYYWMV